MSLCGKLAPYANRQCQWEMLDLGLKFRSSRRTI
jgi:hypothetical protein